MNKIIFTHIHGIITYILDNFPYKNTAICMTNTSLKLHTT